LKNIRLYFCDYSGSSLGVRQALKSPQIVSFLKENPHMNLELYMKRNYHPYMSSTYINGYVKDQSLMNMSQEDIVEWL
jgi:large subunit ribosomal protein L43